MKTLVWTFLLLSATPALAAESNATKCSEGDAFACSKRAEELAPDLESMWSSFQLACGLDARQCGVHEGAKKLRQLGKSAEAITLLKRSCDAKTGMDCFWLSDTYIQSYKEPNYGVRKDAAKGLAILQHACDALLDLTCCSRLENAYEQGIDVPKSHAKAAAIRPLRLKAEEKARQEQLAANAKSDIAEHASDLSMIEKAEGDRSHRLIEEAQCRAGGLSVCYSAAQLYFLSDPDRALELMMRSKPCQEKGWPCFAVTKLADALRRNGQFDKAEKILSTVCSQGVLSICEALAKDYEGTTPGARIDYRKSTALLVKACNGGWSSACAGLTYRYYGGSLGEQPNEALGNKYSAQFDRLFKAEKDDRLAREVAAAREKGQLSPITRKIEELRTEWHRVLHLPHAKGQAPRDNGSFGRAERERMIRELIGELQAIP